MAFKLPQPFLPKKKSDSAQVIRRSPIAGLENLQKTDFSNSELIGKGSYGKIFKVIRNGKEFVVKGLVTQDATDHENDLFLKEAKLMASLKGHPNVLQIHGYSMTDNSLLLEFMSFSFERLNLNNDSVSNLKDLLKTCDRINDFEGFEHMPYHLALDICTGLDYLHQKGIVHRDLKPDNILVSNQHYLECTEEDLKYWWLNKPVVAKLTDFEESRSLLVQTRTLCKTSTLNLIGGSPVYMAPEAILGGTTNADIGALKRMDIWSLGMVTFHLLNPDAKYAYADELNEMCSSSPMEAVKDFLRDKKPPRNLAKYEEKSHGPWSRIVELCSASLHFDASTVI
ncbi:spindle assembly checkpoint kinase-like [Pecten maximus]|uniref:spindle assembly checkpoint kinase-like n=1 Tax=Pecten maximus TaxID=6579 RepID=UPI0014586238|nr:spindle assembly checkpoint kinase-like [Pecten maximus]